MLSHIARFTLCFLSLKGCKNQSLGLVSLTVTWEFKRVGWSDLEWVEVGWSGLLWVGVTWSLSSFRYLKQVVRIWIFNRLRRDSIANEMFSVVTKRTEKMKSCCYIQNTYVMSNSNKILIKPVGTKPRIWYWRFVKKSE